jgi:hypothetical protein
MKNTMTWKLFFIFMLCFTAAIITARSQETSTGIFLTTKIKKNCQNILFTTDKKTKVCVTMNPIISAKDFVYITDIKKDIDNRFSFNLIFSNEGYETLKKLYAQLPNSEFALVVDNSVIGYIKNLEVLKNKTLLIDGTETDILSIHHALEAVVTVRAN